MTLKNDLMIRALTGKPVERTPIWIMRQAGRYLPEYRQTRERAGAFMNLCRHADWACEVTLQPLARYALDAAILFSDILTIPDAMGLGLQFTAGEGPRFACAIDSEKAVASLSPPPAGSLDYVFEAVRTIRRELNGRVPLIGFAGSPWTLATYMIEGGASKDHVRSKAFLYQDAESVRALLALLTQVVSEYLNAQIASGAQVVMIFDTWGGVLPHWAYAPFSLAYMAQIVKNLARDENGEKVPCIIFSKGAGQHLALMKESGADCVGVDWTTSLTWARQRVGESMSLQGNLDPAVLLGDKASIYANVARVLDDYGYGHRHIFNLGHGITPQVSPDAVKILVDAVHELSVPYHAAR